MRFLDFDDGYSSVGAPAVAGQWNAPDGDVSNPGWSWNSDPNTGVRRVGADNMAVVCGGADILYWDTLGVHIGYNGGLIGREKLTVLMAPSSSNASANNYAAWFRYANSNDTAFSQDAIAASMDWRRTITTDITDTSAYCNSLFAYQVFDIASTKTYTHAGVVATVRLGAPANSGAGALAIANYAHMYIEASSLNTGTRKHGVYIGAQTGATNNAALTDNGAFSGNWAINFTNTNPSMFTGPMCYGSQDVASAASITGMACAASITRLTGSTATSLHGITAGKSGQLMILRNLTGQNLTIKDQSATESTAANRIITGTGADVTSTADSCHMFFYDGSTSRWILIAGQA